MRPVIFPGATAEAFHDRLRVADDHAATQHRYGTVAVRVIRQAVKDEHHRQEHGVVVRVSMQPGHDRDEGHAGEEPESGPEPDFPAERHEWAAQLDRIAGHQVDDDHGDDDAEGVGGRRFDLQHGCDARIHSATGERGRDDEGARPAHDRPTQDPAQQAGRLHEAQLGRAEEEQDDGEHGEEKPQHRQEKSSRCRRGDIRELHLEGPAGEDDNQRNRPNERNARSQRGGGHDLEHGSGDDAGQHQPDDVRNAGLAKNEFSERAQQQQYGDLDEKLSHRAHGAHRFTLQTRGGGGR